ncbi:MAG TPA: hypothetical protein VHH55_08325 [Gaiellaceae bacterium]|jgi:hypothetical protein|nr:hypothetical protein [Gaiellaceae bacterium]
MAARARDESGERPVLPRDLYLPESGPPRRRVRRPANVPPMPSGLYLRENGPHKPEEK